MIRKKTATFTGDTVDLDGVTLRYETGRDVLKAVSLKLPQKSFHFLTGASGAGKTSLLSLLYLAQRPSDGVLKVFGEDVTRASRPRLAMLRRRLGVVFQDFRLLDHLSAFDNVALPLRVAGVEEAAVKRDVTELLDWVGLADQMDARPVLLSGGQQQRVAIARAVINRPKLLLADEPTGNVDDNIAVRLMQLFIELHKLGTSVVVATHNETLTARFAFPRLHLENSALTVMPPVAEAG
jgi:cell division transport system ATP-binding protein